jgi:hypothetical protein
VRVFLFQPRFADLVESGLKCQTVRARARCKTGDTVSLRQWIGKPYRSPMRILRESVCVRVSQVKMIDTGIIVDGQIVDANAFARADGFTDWPQMYAWFSTTHGLPFVGDLIQWDPAK